MKLLKNQSGFTLIELVLIIVVLGILAAVAMVQFGNITTDAKNAALDGAVGPYSAQLAIAINNVRALPTGGVTVGTCLPSPGTSTAFVDCVYNMVLHTGTGVTRGAWAAANNSFAICSGSTCGGTAPDIASNGAAPGAGVTCTTGDRYVVLDYQPTGANAGAIFVSAKTDC